MESSSEADADLCARIRQQETIAELDQRALETDDLDRLVRDASIAVKELADVYEWNCAVTESAADGARFEFANVD